MIEVYERKYAGQTIDPDHVLNYTKSSFKIVTMNTQISFTANEELKKKAMQKAKEKGLTLKSVLIFSMEAFVNNQIDFGLVDNEPEVEEMYFDDPEILAMAHKLAKLLE